MSAKSKFLKTEADIEKHRSELNWKKAVEVAKSIEHKTSELGNVRCFFSVLLISRLLQFLFYGKWDGTTNYRITG